MKNLALNTLRLCRTQGVLQLRHLGRLAARLQNPTSQLAPDLYGIYYS